MDIRLSPEHLEWLAREVAAGHFPSIDAAIASAVEALRSVAEADLEWARPYIETADASLARGEGIPGDEFLAELDRKLELLRRT
jgi:Arc/MetJ-type ribon-helix-helix transcriptional regulator